MVLKTAIRWNICVAFYVKFLSKQVSILISAIEYVTYLSNDRDHKNEEIAEMEKKLKALQIVKEYVKVYVLY